MQEKTARLTHVVEEYVRKKRIKFKTDNANLTRKGHAEDYEREVGWAESDCNIMDRRVLYCTSRLMAGLL